MRRTIIAVALLATACSSSGTDHALFRQVYVAQTPHDTDFGEQPPDFTDEQIDEAIARVCPDGPDGRSDPTAADTIGTTHGGDAWGAIIGDAIHTAVRAVNGCDPLPATYDPVNRTDTNHPDETDVGPPPPEWMP